jgi:hypothetical protein
MKNYLKRAAVILAIVVTVAAGAVSRAQAQILAQWTFETSQPLGGASGNWFTNIQAELGSGTASVFHDTQGFVAYSPTGNGSAHSLTTSNWSVGDFYQFSLSTSGYSHIGVSVDVTSGSTGPGRFVLEYSTDGVNFTSIGSTNTILGSGNPIFSSWSSSSYNPSYTSTFDLSSVPALNNSPVVVFRLLDPSMVSANGGTVSGGSPEFIDNFTVSVPEPQTLWIFALVSLCAVRYRRSVSRCK